MAGSRAALPRTDDHRREADSADFDRYEAMVTAKYGMQYRVIKLLGEFMKLIGGGSGTDTAVLITRD